MMSQTESGLEDCVARSLEPGGNHVWHIQSYAVTELLANPFGWLEVG